ncbi:MAG: GNAT family N-acetyltransferase [Clostridia bacterium]|nr:GNAT family N-acetyltransferase [Clostridia bacterium]
MLLFNKVNTNQDIEQMSRLATSIMKKHYDPIVGSKTNDHMLEKYQSVRGITDEINGGAEYYFVSLDGANIGFVAVDAKADYLYLSKFYLAIEYRGKGYASPMMAFVKDYAKARGLKMIKLNVNADNTNTVGAYKHFGFEAVEEYQRDVGEGFFVHDYVMVYRERV